VLAGELNTAITYAMYLLVLSRVAYLWAYGIAYVAGVGIAYVLHARIVFRASMGWRSMVRCPVVYVTQFTVNAGALWVLIEILGVREGLAPLLAVAVTVPAIYWTSRAVFR
jgi:putative flippase GtrA